MPRTFAARDRVLQVASQRLSALVGARQEVSTPEQQPIVIDAPENALRPIAQAAAVICLLLAIMVWLNRPQAITPIDVQSTGVTVAGPSSDSAGTAIDGPRTISTQTPATIVVDVEGYVRRPGLVTLPADARVADAIAEAGGLTRKLSPGALNLAQKLADGQLIVVATHATQSSSLSAGGGGSGSMSALININSASATDLDALPGVGPVMSGRIVAWRTENGGFKSVDDLQQVPGIGPKVFANLKPLVCI